MLTSKHYDRIHNQVTMYSFALLFGGKVAAKMQVTRPCRMRTGMERFTATLQLFRNASGGPDFSDAAAAAGGCGYDKIAESMASAINAAGLDGSKVRSDRRLAPWAIAQSLRLPDGQWQVIEF